MPTRTLNYLLYQTGWFACVLGASWHHEATGVAIALALIAVHLGLAQERAIEAPLIAIALGVGLVSESLQLAADTYEPHPSLLPGGMPPAWLLVLWAQFATTFRYSLSNILQRPWRAALFGALGGPLAFFAADGLGALQMPAPAGSGYVRLSAAWTLALIGFSWLTRRWWRSFTSAPVYRSIGGLRAAAGRP